MDRGTVQDHFTERRIVCPVDKLIPPSSDLGGPVDEILTVVPSEETLPEIGDWGGQVDEIL